MELWSFLVCQFSALIVSRNLWFSIQRLKTQTQPRICIFLHRSNFEIRSTRFSFTDVFTYRGFLVIFIGQTVNCSTHGSFYSLSVRRFHCVSVDHSAFCDAKFVRLCVLLTIIYQSEVGTLVSGYKNALQENGLQRVVFGKLKINIII